MWKKETIDGKKMIALPPVQLKQHREVLNLPKLDVLDIRPFIPMEKPVIFTGKLYNGEKIDGIKTVKQQKLVDQWMVRKSGIIESPARSGKSCVAAKIVCDLQVKTLFIGSKKEYLRQFYETFVGGRKRKAMTNLKDVEDKYNYIRIIEKISDFKDCEQVEILLVNYQKFIRNKKAIDRIKKYLSNRTLLVCDENHQAAASAYIKFISELKCPYRLALTATWRRKDSRSLLLTHYFGNVTAKAVVQSYIPEIHITQTPFKYKYQPKLWVYAMKLLAKNDKRNKLIVKMLKKDFKAGHKAVILPVDFLEHAKDLQNLINNKFGEGSARIFSSRCDQEATLEDFDAGEYKVLIAIRSMIKENIDLKIPSLLYMIIPMSASKFIEDGELVGAPLFYQLAMRVATRAPNKPQPIVRLFYDQIGQSMGCFKSLYYNEILPRSEGKNPRYKLPQSTVDFAATIAPPYKGYAPAKPHLRSLLV